MAEALTVWSNTTFSLDATEKLRRGLTPHRLLLSEQQVYNLGVSSGDPLLEQADVAFGQPKPEQVMALPRVKWVHLTTAGYARYDRDDFRHAVRERGGAMTNSSTVYAEPCAQHAVAFMLALSRELPAAMDNQRGARGWTSIELRARSRLFTGQTALIVGFGAIGRRIAELLAPYRMNLIAVRRTPRGDEPVHAISDSQIDKLLPQADHVINTLPESPATEGFFSADRLAQCKPTAYFYNVGRGSTVDQEALRMMLQRGKLGAAYLDVMTPEPLPVDDPLWNTPNCYVTPHTAGGHDRDHESSVSHFLENFRRYTIGEALLDRIV